MTADAFHYSIVSSYQSHEGECMLLMVLDYLTLVFVSDFLQLFGVGSVNHVIYDGVH